MRDESERCGELLDRPWGDNPGADCCSGSHGESPSSRWMASHVLTHRVAASRRGRASPLSQRESVPTSTPTIRANSRTLRPAASRTALPVPSRPRRRARMSWVISCIDPSLAQRIYKHSYPS